MIAEVEGLIEREQYRQAGDLADGLRAALLKPGVRGRQRKRGMMLLKTMYRVQGDTDALVALQEDEVSALEGALSEARIGQR